MAGRVIKQARVVRRPFSVIPPEVPDDLLEMDPVVRDRTTTLSPEEAEREAERILAAAHAEARQILETAKNQARTIEEGARRAGFEEGRRLAQEEVKPKADRALRVLSGLAEKIVQERLRLLAQVRELLPDIVIEIARRVLQREASVDRTFVGAVVEEALRQVSGHDRIILYVNPEDVAVVEALRSEWATSCSGVVTVIADSSVDPGGCIVESPQGLVDARLTTKLQEIHERLQEVIHNGSSQQRGPQGMRSISWGGK